jgi:hypothetical protein
VIDAWRRNPFLSPLSGRPSPLRLTQGDFCGPLRGAIIAVSPFAVSPIVQPPRVRHLHLGGLPLRTSDFGAQVSFP